MDACGQGVCANEGACTCSAEDHVGSDERVEISLRLASALWRFWQFRGHLAEGRQRTERILAIPGIEKHGIRYLKALEAAGGVTYWQGDLDATEVTYKQRLALARELGDEIELANALYDLSFVYLVPGKEVDAGEALLNDALAIFRRRGDRAGIAKTLWGLAGLYGQRGRYDEAARVTAEVIPIFREQKNHFGLAWALHMAGVSHMRLGRPEEARATLAEGMHLFVEAGDVSGIILYLFDHAELAASGGRTDRALRLYGAMTALREATGSQLSISWEAPTSEAGRLIRELNARTEPALRDRLTAEGARLSQETAIAFALSERDAP